MTLQEAAAYASSLTGLPVAFVQALIRAEGSLGKGDWVNGSIVNNPFDVTTTWAKDAGYGDAVTGSGGSQGDIASFTDPSVAIQAWAEGINNFPLYAQLRADLVGGKNASVLAKDLAKTGYAGSNPGQWVTNMVDLVSNLIGGAVNQAGQATGVTAAKAKASPVTVPPLPSLSFPDVTGALSSIASSASGAASSVGQAVSDAQTLIGFLQLPQLYLRLSLGLLGGLLIIVGLVLFAVSFMPRSVGQQLTTVAKAAAA